VVAAAIGGAVVAAAPHAARAWVAATVSVGWLCVTVTILVALLKTRRLRAATTAANTELRAVQGQLAQTGAESAHLVNVTLPSVVKRLRDGESPADALASTPTPTDQQLRRVLETFAAEVGAGERRAETSAAHSADALQQLTRTADDLDRLTTVTMPAAIAHLRRGASAETVLAELDQPADARLRVLLDSAVRELATSERRSAAAQGASAKALGRVQAKTMSMLADLREMQDRHGEEVLGDLLRLDHNTSQLGLLTDRLSLLMGGRASRSWNKPIGMESILRGAVGRIAAYQRVRLHSSSTVMVAGFAAEGVMHLLAELMDNAANFSPPIDEVHVYVEERTAGLVVTIEDSGLKMAEAAMRRAKEAVSGRTTDLATLQGTRLGLAVVGRLAAKYHMSVSFRPSSRGGTGVVVLFPPQLLAQQRSPHPEQSAGRPAVDPAVRVPDALTVSGAGTTLSGLPGSASGPASGLLPSIPAPRPAIPSRGAPRVATTNGLPVRPRGRTMAAADRGRPDPGAPPAETHEAPGRDAGAQFGAFHRSLKATDGDQPGTDDDAER
jgi:signal transduction histidine kinase